MKKLLEVANLVPLMGAVALAIVALFNVGYFMEAGLHFVGIIDVSNIVYSFGLILPFVIAAIWLSVTDIAGALLVFTQREGAYDAFTRVVVRYVIPVVLLVTAAGFFAWLKWGWVPSWFHWTFTFAIWLAYNLINLSAKYNHNGAIHHSDAIATALAFVVVVVMAGRAMAYSQIHFQEHTYTIATADVTILNARIVRSSSSGFLIVVADRVTFLPKEQIKLIRADRDVQR